MKLGNFLALPFTDHSFDFVVSSFAFHHLSPDQQLLALQEMQWVLTSRGRIGLTDLMFVDATHRDSYIRQAETTGHEGKELLPYASVTSLCWVSYAVAGTTGLCNQTCAT